MAGFGYNQTPVSSGGISSTSSSWDYALAQGPPGVGTSSGVGQPSSYEAMIPVWGPSRASVDYFQNGNYGLGLFYAGVAVSDLFLVKSITTAFVRGAWKFGPHSWSVTRKWLGMNGYAQPGQHVHHWAITQATSKKYGLNSIANQPWNLVTISPLGPFSSQTVHNAIHGRSRLLYLNYGQRLWYGTPTWFKSSLISVPGRIPLLID